MTRRSYLINITINERKIKEIIIDSHYEEKHSATVNDNIILSLVNMLDGSFFEPDELDEEGYEYYATEPHFYNGKPYKLIWLLPNEGSYIGIINCYRRSYDKK